MKYTSFLLFAYFLITVVYAGPNDKWVPVESVAPRFDGIALIFAVAAFVWAYLIYRDLVKKKGKITLFGG